MVRLSRLLMAIGILVLPAQVYAEELTDSQKAALSGLESKLIQDLTSTDLASYLELRAKEVGSSLGLQNPREEVGAFAKRSIGQAYRRNAVQFDTAESDCVSFVNSMLALSVASDWSSYYVLVERLRHKDGIPDYRNRNFFTLSDWIPNNAWLLEDVTGTLGSSTDRPAQTFTHVISPKRFDERPSAPGSKFTRIKFLGADLESAHQEVRTDMYIPLGRMDAVLADLKTGDVVIVLVKGKDDDHLHCEHQGLIVREAGSVDILHSASPRVLQEPLSRFQERCFWIAGMKFLRLRENAREIAAQEVTRLASRIQTPSPSEQDAKNHKLRTARAAAAQSGS